MDWSVLFGDLRDIVSFRWVDGKRRDGSAWMGMAYIAVAERAAIAVD